MRTAGAVPEEREALLAGSGEACECETEGGDTLVAGTEDGEALERETEGGGTDTEEAEVERLGRSLCVYLARLREALLPLADHPWPLKRLARLRLRILKLA